MSVEDLVGSLVPVSLCRYVAIVDENAQELLLIWSSEISKYGVGEGLEDAGALLAEWRNRDADEARARLRAACD